MKIKLFLDKSVEENASIYYEKAKKSKKKLEGAKEALEISKKKLKKAEKEHAKAEKEIAEEQEKEDVKKDWYEKFRWFFTSDGFLCIGGRDATTNEIVIKKHTDANDLVFHTDMAGSPFFVIKSEGKKISQQAIEETAIATASFSRAWKLGLSSLDVFYVKPEQVTKKAKAGEFVSKGSFMVYGETNYLNPEVKLAIGKKDDKIMCGPAAAVQKYSKDFLTITQGEKKPSEIAKKIQRKLGGSLDDIIRILPSGGCEVS